MVAPKREIDDEEDMVGTLELVNFLDRYTPQCEESAVWGEGTLPLHITAYLGQETPPLSYVTSTRSLVFRGDELLVFYRADAARRGRRWRRPFDAKRSKRRVGRCKR